MKEVNFANEDTATSAQKLARAYSQLATDLEKEMKDAARAADLLGDALGPEIASRANLDSIVQNLRNMGLTFEEITTDVDVLATALKDLDRVQVQGPARGLEEIDEGARKAKVRC